MDRKSIILTGIDIEKSKGIEIGPLKAPIVPKSEGQVLYLDHLPTEELKSKYKGHGFDVNEIVEVDYVWQANSSLKEVVGEQRFDYVIASHVLEHLPNPIGWLGELWEILEPAGKLSLAIPDKRFCFDYFRMPTSTGDIIESYLEDRKKPSARAVFDAIGYAASYQGHIAWSESLSSKHLHRIHTLEQAFETARNVAHHDLYHDVHVWCFTPVSLLRILRDLTQLKLFNFSVFYFYDTVGCEFYIVLQKERKGTKTSTLLEKIPHLASLGSATPEEQCA
jgi:predicted SAM-dependent methyltransferase